MQPPRTAGLPVTQVLACVVKLVSPTCGPLMDPLDRICCASESEYFHYSAVALWPCAVL